MSSLTNLNVKNFNAVWRGREQPGWLQLSLYFSQASYPTYPKILPLTLKCFLQILKFEDNMRKYNQTVHLKNKAKELCILKYLFL